MRVWQRPQDLAVEVLRLVKGLPGDRASSVLATQLVRAASSIGANIAEGHGRYSRGAYRNHLSIARGSTAETISWIDVLRRAGMIGEATDGRVTEICEEIMRMLTAKMVELDKQTGTDRTLREDGVDYDV